MAENDINLRNEIETIAFNLTKLNIRTIQINAIESFLKYYTTIIIAKSCTRNNKLYRQYIRNYLKNL